MQTTGPYILSAGTPLDEYDPGGSWQPQSTAVQVQNNSGYQLNINLGGQVYAVNPFTQTTVPTNNSSLMIITPNQVLSNFGGSVTLVWLQAGESPPSPDGTLFAPNTNQGGVLSDGFGAVPGYGAGPSFAYSNWFGPAVPAAGFANRLQAITFWNPSNAAATLILAAQPYPTYPYPSPVMIETVPALSGDYKLFNGLLVPNAFMVAQNPSTAGVYFNLYYDLVQV